MSNKPKSQKNDGLEGAEASVARLVRIDRAAVAPAITQQSATGIRVERRKGDRRQASLTERLAFERLLADLSARFANVPVDRVETGIEEALKQLVDFLGFDRSSFG